MTIQELLERIQSANSEPIKIERHSVRVGNADGSGNYSIIKFTIDGKVIQFNNSNGTWAAD